MSLCPCYSQKEYESCCWQFHDGAPPTTAVKLMRSRFCAYSMHLPNYIIQTTHSSSEHTENDIFKWRESILDFCEHTHFKGLTILEYSRDTVTFTAHLSNGEKDITFTEKSLFRKEAGALKYLQGIHI
jgi:SEC-C motif-containing protein